MPDEKSCGILLFSEDGKRLYLLLHYTAGHWDFPKGHVEPDESEAETALRELLEETGLTGVEFIPGFRERIRYRFQRGAEEVRKEVVFFLGRIPSAADVRISHEHVGYEWLPPDAALQRLTFDTAKSMLRKAEGSLAPANNK